MKKFANIIGGIFCALMIFGCSNLDELGSDSGDENFGTLYFNSNSRLIDVSEISTATVNVYGYGMETISKSGVAVSGGKGELSVQNIPIGKNRVIEICGYKTTGVSVKILYAVTDINAGANSIGIITDGADSAKGKAYLALLNAGVDISSVSLSGFDDVSSAYLFDADGFASAYKNNSFVSAKNYVQTAGTVKFTNISNAAGYSIWIDDPLSSKVSLSGTETSANATGVAPGTWNVYVNDTSSTKKVGSVTVTSGGTATYSTLIGDALAGKTIVFVKCAANTNLYAWTKTSKTELCGAWSGTTLTTKATSDYMNDPTGWYMINVTEKYGSSTETIQIILIPAGGSKTGDLDSKIAGTFWYDGSTFYDSDPTATPVLDSDATLSDIKVNGSSLGAISGTSFTKALTGSEDSLSVSVTAEANASTATVKVTDSQTISDGSSATFTITVTNGTGKATYTVTVSYTKAEVITSEYYWTNKNGAVGTNKTISSFSDWTEDMKIAQGAANDDPRVFAKWSMHENPNDAYALFAAYDDTNLYLMVELANVQDIVAPGENYPLSDNGQFWNRGTPFFFAFETGKGVGGTGAMVSTGDAYIWNNAVEFSNKNVDTMIVCHSNPEKGTPGVFRTNSSGLFDYKNGLCETFTENNISVSWDGGANKTQGLVSKNLYGIKACGTDQGRLAENILTDDYVDFNTLSHNTNLDLKWQITIPLSSLKITKSELESTGIGVMFVLSDGASGMDCLPWDSTMIDNAALPYSKDTSTSAEKDDTDIITVPFARIGHM